MAKAAKVMLTCAFLLALILSCEIIPSEARQFLKAKKSVAEENKSAQEKDLSSSHARIFQSKVLFPKSDNSNVTSPSPGLDNEVVDEAEGTDDFRSTTPGRSPGVGH